MITSRKVRSPPKTLTSTQAANLGQLPSELYPIMSRNQPRVVGKLSATSRRTRAAVTSLVDESFCHDITQREFSVQITKALKAYLKKKGDLPFETIRVGPMPVDRDGNILVPDRPGVLEASIYRIVEGERGISVSLSTLIFLERAEWDKEHVLVYRQPRSSGTTRDWKDMANDAVGDYGNVLRTKLEPVINYEVMMTILEAKVPCTSRDREYATNEVLSVLERQGLQIVSLLGLGRGDVLQPHFLRTQQELVDLLRLGATEDEEEPNEEEEVEEEENIAPFPDKETMIRYGNAIRLLAYWTYVTGLDRKGKALSNANRPAAYNITEALRYGLYFLRQLLTRRAAFLQENLTEVGHVEDVRLKQSNEQFIQEVLQDENNEEPDEE